MGNSGKMYSPSPHGLSGALRQGEILTNVVELQIKLETITSIEAEADYSAKPVKHPFAIVVSQDCDLEQDFNFRFYKKGKPRNILPSVLFCQVMETEKLEKGLHKHLFDSKTFKDYFRNNKDFRFHFVQEIPAEYDALGKKLPELGMEFKRYFSMPTAEIYHRIEMSHTQRRCRLQSPYVEHFCDRFYNFNKRIALPEEYQSV